MIKLIYPGNKQFDLDFYNRYISFHLIWITDNIMKPAFASQYCFYFQRAVLKLRQSIRLHQRRVSLLITSLKSVNQQPLQLKTQIPVLSAIKSQADFDLLSRIYEQGSEYEIPHILFLIDRE